MVLPAGLMHRSARNRRGDRLRHRLKSGPFPLGATRFRLIQALTDLGIYLAFQSMTEEQQAAERLEDQIVSWLSADEPGV